VRQFVERFSSVVAEENLEQTITVPRRKRTMRADFLFVRLPGDQLWTAFRDVFDVDGKPVRDRDERVMKLLTAPPNDSRRRIREILEESARHNLINIGTISNPLLVVAFLQEFYQPRFRFNLAGMEKDLGPHIRVVQFQEIKGPTLIRGDANQDILSRGLVWIDEETGRLAKTELRIGGTAAPITVTTLFTFDETLGMDVPSEMREWYPDRVGELRSTATYGRFRRFQVSTSEQLK
jgi:hypothetical protein